MQEIFNWFLIAMTATAVIVFVALHWIDAGYGMLISKKWGFSVNNKLGWVLMESPVFIMMAVLWWMSDRAFDPTLLVIFLIFESHYFQRSFIFPLLLRGNSKMPFSIILMGVIFNTLNAIMQGGWLFYLAPEGMYTPQWMCSPQFIVGVVMFYGGMYININSDKIIRNLRKPGDTGHYIPKGGMFKYVSSANYFGELVEWTGFAILTWSLSGAVFVIWTFANLAPRAFSLYKAYQNRFGQEFTSLKRKRIIPFIY